MDSHTNVKKTKKDCVICATNVVSVAPTCWKSKCKYLYACERATYWTLRASTLQDLMNHSSSEQTVDRGFCEKTKCRGCGNESRVKNGCGQTCTGDMICQRCVCPSVKCRTRVLHQLRANVNTARRCFTEGCSAYISHQVLDIFKDTDSPTVECYGVKYGQCKECDKEDIPNIYCSEHYEDHLSHMMRWKEWLKPIDDKPKRKRKRKQQQQQEEVKHQKKQLMMPPPPPPPAPLQVRGPAVVRDLREISLQAALHPTRIDRTKDWVLDMNLSDIFEDSALDLDGEDGGGPLTFL